MRDVLLVLVLVGAALPALIHPWVGVMLWTWVSIMSPHRLSWNISHWPVAMVAALVTLVGLFATRDARRWPVAPATWLILLLMMWMGVTTAFALEPSAAWPALDRVGKILFMVLVTIAVLHTRRHIEWFVAVIAGSLAFYGFKGGVFTFITGGEFRVWGPPDTFIADNNEMALALVMTIPLLRYFHLRAPRGWQRAALLGVIAACVLAVLGSHSRGAFVAGAAMALLMWVRGGCRPGQGLLIGVLAASAIALMPAAWETRMSSIATYDQDASVQGRFSAWQTARSVAQKRITGGGMGMWTPKVFAAYNPEARSVHVAHSIYFQVLGEHGAIGLILFLSIWGVTWAGAGRLIRETRDEPDTRWLAQLAGMVQLSLVAYAVGGTFYSLAYFDLPYDLAALVVLGRYWLDARRTPVREVRSLALA